ncbi:MAG: MIP/aquaporin family protein [Pseudomonadota bacterium]|nr:MIP/aquaporin family protein [Pseudomonadota bacterium]
MTEQSPPKFGLGHRLAAEGLGTAALLAGVVGSGIMAERLAGGNDAVALLANTAATGAILAVLILVFGSISGAHFNPAVTLAFVLRRRIAGRDAVAYGAVQVIAALIGVGLAHVMFGEPLIQHSTTMRAAPGMWLAEVVATVALVGTILACLRWRPGAVPYAVGLVISAGYWYTSSTSFANPAVTLGRAFTDTFSGIRLADAPAFIAAQLIGAILATWIFRWFESGER